jgi:hypothetical protein
MRRFAAFGTALLLILSVAAPAAATKPVGGGGTYVVTGVSPEGCILLLVGLEAGETLYGTATVCQRGNSGSDKATFEGTVHLDGYPPMDGTARVNFSRTDRFSITGTGELKGLHGQGVAEDDLTEIPPRGTYEGRFHFDSND